MTDLGDSANAKTLANIIYAPSTWNSHSLLIEQLGEQERESFADETKDCTKGSVREPRGSSSELNVLSIHCDQEVQNLLWSMLNYRLSICEVERSKTRHNLSRISSVVIV